MGGGRRGRGARMGGWGAPELPRVGILPGLRLPGAFQRDRGEVDAREAHGTAGDELGEDAVLGVEAVVGERHLPIEAQWVQVLPAISPVASGGFTPRIPEWASWREVTWRCLRVVG